MKIREYNETVVITSDGRELYRYQITGELLSVGNDMYKTTIQCGDEVITGEFMAESDTEAIVKIDKFVEQQAKIVRNTLQGFMRNLEVR